VSAIRTTCVIVENPNFVSKCRRRNEDNIKIYTVKCVTQTGVNRKDVCKYSEQLSFLTN